MKKTILILNISQGKKMKIDVKSCVIIALLLFIMLTFAGCGGCNSYSKGYSVGYEDCRAGKWKKLFPIIWTIPGYLFAVNPEFTDNDIIAVYSENKKDIDEYWEPGMTMREAVFRWADEELNN